MARSEFIVAQRVARAVFDQASKVLVANVGKKDRASLGSPEGFVA
jgi:hypothetical protein